ncbi:MAG: dihydrolipoamide acetyltransferase family protein, partial [Gemmatimonadota bacterium]
ELVARGDGALRKVFLGEGGTAPVGSVIAVIADLDEDISGVESGVGDGGAGAVAAPAAASGGDGGDGGEAAAPAAAEAPTKEAAAPAQPAPAAPSTDEGGRVKASPLARRLADDLGVDLSRVSGSGPGGRIVKRDVEAAKEQGVAAPAAAWTPSEEEYEDVQLSQMRKTIAKRLVESIGPVPHFFLTIDVDMGRVMEARKGINAMLEPSGEKVSINDILLKAVAGALRRHPESNAQWLGTHIRRFNAVHLGVAVAIDEGLITPVVKNAHLKGIAQIAREVRELAARAREKKLMPEEYTGSTFSVSNLGMFGIHEFTAIINPPEAGILAVGGIEETPVVEDGQVVVRPRMRITMSCDHRVIDGAQGSRFLATLKAMLEEPTAILV